MGTGGTQTAQVPESAEERAADAWAWPDAGRAPAAELLDAVEVRITRAAPRTGAEMAAADRPWPGRMRRIVRAKLRAWSRETCADSAELLVTELTSNAFQHGTAAEVGVRLVLTAGCIVIEVDDGTPAPPRLRTVGPLEENGRGLLLVVALSDAWGVSPDGTRTWCSLTTRTPGRI